MSLRVQIEAALRVWEVRWRYRQVKPQRAQRAQRNG